MPLLDSIALESYGLLRSKQVMLSTGGVLTAAKNGMRHLCEAGVRIIAIGAHPGLVQELAQVALAGPTPCWKFNKCAGYRTLRKEDSHHLLAASFAILLRITALRSSGRSGTRLAQLWAP